MSAPAEAAFPAAALRDALEAARPRRIVGCSLEHHASLESTNDRARDLSLEGAAEGTVVIADEQTRGRGRSGRSWHSPAGPGLYLSVLLRPAGRTDRSPLLALATAVAAAEGLRRAAGVGVFIKWPNDLVMLDEAGRRLKVGGILTEARAGAEGLRDVVVGIGVNVNHQPHDFPAALARMATSLRMARGRVVDRAGVALEILCSLDDWYRVWCEAGDTPLLDAYRASAVDLEDRVVRVTEGQGPAWEGITAGLADDGGLRVRRRGEDLVTVRYGEIERVEEI
ncbi:MAG: biotin--[acetyl-CoA-carboxylase] ligase [Candidatus Polarisedimenticolia bacterium]